MEYIILDTYPTINGQTVSNFVNISNLDIAGNMVHVNISNLEATTYSIPIINFDVETSVKNFFLNING
jgi:hypothetical protein